MATLGELTTEATGTLTTVFSIKNMSVDLFEFWLEDFLPSITYELNVTAEPTIKNAHIGQFVRYKPIAWPDNAFTIIGWAQTFLDTVQVSISGGRELEDKLIAWASARFGITEPKQEESKFKLKIIDDDLTKKEKTVAGYLAEGLTFNEIAKRMDKTENTILSHCQHIAKKWGVRRVQEILQQQAQQRGYSHLKQ